MKRRDVLVADVILCSVLLISALMLGAYGLIAILIIVTARIVLQKMVYDNYDELITETFRKKFFNFDTVSFEVLFISVAISVTAALHSVSLIVSLTAFSVIVLFRLVSEYFWFSDRPNRWYSFRFVIYDIRRKLNPTYSERLQKILVAEVDGMKGREFERYVAELLIMNGFTKVKVTKGSGDIGVDVTAVLNKDIYAIQCRRSDSEIGTKVVQEAVLGKEHYNADVAVVITNNYFTAQAYEAAEGKAALWDRERLGGLVRKARDSVSDERYNEEMIADRLETKMFIALFDKGKGDARLTEKVMGTLYPEGDVRSEKDIDEFLKKVTEHIHGSEGIPERRLKRTYNALDVDKPITPYEADIACYHLNGTHTITIRDMDEVRNKLAQAFIESEYIRYEAPQTIPDEEGE